MINRLLFRFITFFHDWYVHGSRFIGHHLIEILSSLDQTFALKVTLKYLLRPLYKDYTIVGRILGPIFRVGRVLIGAVMYVVIIAIFLAVYIIWVSIPILIMLYALSELIPAI